MTKLYDTSEISYKDPLSFDIHPWKKVAFQVASSSISSIIEVFLMLPLDVVKTRLQLQMVKTTQEPTSYKGFIDALFKIYRQEGLAAYWRGIAPVMVSDTPKRAIKFLIFEQSKPYFQFGAPQPTALTYALAGGLGGTTEVLFQNPFEVIKVTQQANRKNQLSTIRLARHIIKNDGFGLRGLYKGVTTTMARNCLFHIIYFSFFFTVREAIAPSQDSTCEFLRKFSIAYAAGALGCISSLPLDMAKTRIQGPQPVAGEIKYAWAWKTIATVYKEEGFQAIYKGMVPQILRVGPGGAILLLGYEYLYDFLITNFS
ncbi:mitochondrial 2-oxodicarboxylate carrier [Drosophila grimshawi]|uniref:Mitochondrial 2-oxodicarboxylate carrier n=1 Tax=Drosophila grimshawi TaxID=7222 RepID=B4JQ62_DROGR|nr:mitochondrial 2-oxodicarboxylate carrier [Drosophila grimshawi]EDV99042.1 GH13646 [Drosophila grimshawi]